MVLQQPTAPLALDRSACAGSIASLFTGQATGGSVNESKWNGSTKNEQGSGPKLPPLKSQAVTMMLDSKTVEVSERHGPRDLTAHIVVSQASLCDDSGLVGPAGWNAVTGMSR